MGVLSILVGLAVMGFAYLSPAVAPGSSTLNLGLLNDRIVLAMIGLAFVIIGSAVNVSAAIRQGPEAPLKTEAPQGNSPGVVAVFIILVMLTVGAVLFSVTSSAGR